MHEMVREFLETQEAAEKEKYEEEKQATLMKLGFYEKEYSLYDGEYYKKVPIEITDEEYEQIKKYLEQHNSDNDANTNDNIDLFGSYFRQDNKIAMIFQILGWLTFILGLIIGFIIIPNGFTVCFGCLIISFLSGMTMLGFAEIIKLLEAIKNK